MDRVQEHLIESYHYFPIDRVVGIFLQGSQNYKLDIPGSDVDTKLIVTPTFEEIAMNRKPHSTTHIRANNEHIDFKDIRLMIQTYKKQNLNFVETLFTDFQILNPLYEVQWNRLREAREDIAHYCPHQAVTTMKGIAEEKYHAMEHHYPSKEDVLAIFGYDPKQLHHLLRVQEYLKRYIAGEPYADCLVSNKADFLKEVKMGCFNLEEARRIAEATINDVRKTADEYREKTSKEYNKEVELLLDDVQYEIMKAAVLEELK